LSVWQYNSQHIAKCNHLFYHRICLSHGIELNKFNNKKKGFLTMTFIAVTNITNFSPLQAIVGQEIELTGTVTPAKGGVTAMSENMGGTKTTQGAGRVTRPCGTAYSLLPPSVMKVNFVLAHTTAAGWQSAANRLYSDTTLVFMVFYRVAPWITPSGLPQIRTCDTNAYGSSKS
jgi:hypothetical protein